MAPEGSIGAEIGVATGQLTQRFMELRHFSSFHAVDKWDDHHDMQEYESAVRLLEPYESKLVIHRMEAKEWLSQIDDGILGFIYIDCYAKNGQEKGAILDAAWPKLAEGGLFAGDDYETRYPVTVESVDRFAADHDKKVNVYDRHLNKLMAGECKSVWDRSQSWYIRK